jgi:hypothetical protein
MDKSKASPNEIYEVLEQQKKLIEIRSHINALTNKITQTVQSLAVK